MATKGAVTAGRRAMSQDQVELGAIPVTQKGAVARLAVTEEEGVGARQGWVPNPPTTSLPSWPREVVKY